ncbi:hypothetical protein M407DRAFT_7800 [Tulasnella calospora MUT 4182]|uniref:Uncharacterized protein n=1 Tax=Tulasnella calospora MUT 4182 TaxID=1051891 RepID=A0A0C3QJT2_9AGAM|nr:hypothetical protein M407DRAFT_7800 [Tulasnella calospora MUT 4182]
MPSAHDTPLRHPPIPGRPPPPMAQQQPTPLSQFHLDVPATSSDAVPSRPTSPPRQHAKRPSLSRQSTSNRSHLGANYPVSLGSGHPSTSNVNVRRLPLSSDESLIMQLGGATRSFSMPVPEHVQQEQQEASSSAGSSRNPNETPTSPRNRHSRPPYVRGSSTITGSAGLNVMSDDEGEKRAFQPVLSKTSTDDSSMRDRVVSQSRDDRAEYVHDVPMEMSRGSHPIPLIAGRLGRW